MKAVESIRLFTVLLTGVFLAACKTTGSKLDEIKVKYEDGKEITEDSRKRYTVDTSNLYLKEGERIELRCNGLCQFVFIQKDNNAVPLKLFDKSSEGEAKEIGQNLFRADTFKFFKMQEKSQQLVVKVDENEDFRLYSKTIGMKLNEMLDYETFRGLVSLEGDRLVIPKDLPVEIDLAKQAILINVSKAPIVKSRLTLYDGRKGWGQVLMVFDRVFTSNGMAPSYIRLSSLNPDRQPQNFREHSYLTRYYNNSVVNEHWLDFVFLLNRAIEMQREVKALVYTAPETINNNDFVEILIIKGAQN